MNYELLSEAGAAAVIAGADPELLLASIVFGEWAWLDELDPADVVGGFCKHGHPWNTENSYFNPKGYRRCRECARGTRYPDRNAEKVRHREYRARKRLAA